MCGSVLPQWCHKLLESYIIPGKRKKYDDNKYICVHYIFLYFYHVLIILHLTKITLYCNGLPPINLCRVASAILY